jgi:hypothetical protein
VYKPPVKDTTSSAESARNRTPSENSVNEPNTKSEPKITLLRRPNSAAVPTKQPEASGSNSSVASKESDNYRGRDTGRVYRGRGGGYRGRRGG